MLEKILARRVNRCSHQSATRYLGHPPSCLRINSYEDWIFNFPDVESYLTRVWENFIWMFPKIGVGPQNGWFIMENPMNKWMIWIDLEVFPSFLETPILKTLQLCCFFYCLLLWPFAFPMDFQVLNPEGKESKKRTYKPQAIISPHVFFVWNCHVGMDPQWVLDPSKRIFSKLIYKQKMAALLDHNEWAKQPLFYLFCPLLGICGAGDAKRTAGFLDTGHSKRVSWTTPNGQSISKIRARKKHCVFQATRYLIPSRWKDVMENVASLWDWTRWRFPRLFI